MHRIPRRQFTPLLLAHLLSTRKVHGAPRFGSVSRSPLTILPDRRKVTSDTTAFQFASGDSAIGP